jgi:arylsulfatase
MVHNIDQNVGRLLAKLDEWGIAKNTLLVFMNDNGGTAGVKTFNAGMHGAKGSPWIGGVRAISFWRWPGTLVPGQRGQLTAHIDFFRTAAGLAGVPLPEPLLDQSAEGRSLLPLLADADAPWPDRFLFTHVGRWPKGTDPSLTKLRNATVRNTQYTLVSEAQKEGKWQLYDVLADPAQSKDIAAEKPAVVKALSEEFDAWWTSLKGQYDVHEHDLGPKLNPYAELYWKQFGGGPTPADYERMDPARAMTFETGKGAKKKAKAK